jgi:FixJ family two-component response regulator
MRIKIRLKKLNEIKCWGIKIYINQENDKKIAIKRMRIKIRLKNKYNKMVKDKIEKQIITKNINTQKKTIKSRRTKLDTKIKWNKISKYKIEKKRS